MQRCKSSKHARTRNPDEGKCTDLENNVLVEIHLRLFFFKYLTEYLKLAYLS